MTVYTAPTFMDGTPYGAVTWQALADEVARLSAASAVGTVVARGRVEANSGETTTELEILVLPVGTLTYGNLYEISTNTLDVYCDTNNCGVYAHVRYTVDGTDPTTASDVLPGALTEFYPTNMFTSRSNAPIFTTYTPAAAGENLTLLLTIGEYTGAGNVKLLADTGAHMVELRVKNLGIDPGDTGEAP